LVNYFYFSTGITKHEIRETVPMKMLMRLYVQSIFYCVIETTDIGAEYGDVRPLDRAHIRMLTVNGVQLLDHIDSNDAFVTELASPVVGCITRPQRQHIVEMVHSRDRNDKLLEFLTRRSVASFNQFIKALSRHQENLVHLLVTDGGETVFHMQVEKLSAISDC